MNAYEQKQAERKARYEAQAEAARAEAKSCSKAAHAAIEHIPPGQPILVGHHSERRHRGDLARHDRNMRGMVDALDRAEHYERKADGVGRGGISSDDPEATDKLRTKIEAAEASQAYMVAVNKAWRKAGRPKPDNLDGWKAVAEAIGEPPSAMERARLDLARFPYQGQPYASFSLSNNSANIKRMKDRLADLERRTEAQTVEKTEANGVRIVENVEENRLQIIFPGKPDEKTRKMLKSHGFRWAPSACAWQRQLNASARYAAQDVLSAL